MKKSKKNFINECLNLKKRILDISQQVKAIHAAGAFSCLEIVFFIYFELVKFSKKGRPVDTFIMSKGHGCMSQYVILEKLNILKKKDIDNYCTAKGILVVILIMVIPNRSFNWVLRTWPGYRSWYCICRKIKRVKKKLLFY